MRVVPEFLMCLVRSMRLACSLLSTQLMAPLKPQRDSITMHKVDEANLPKARSADQEGAQVEL